MSELQVLLLTPSNGRGGGIERYVQTVESALAGKGVRYRRLDLVQAGLRSQLRLWAQAREELRREGRSSRLILAHPALLPLGWLLHREGNVSGISVICHGSDVWGGRSWLRSVLERWLMRRLTVRLVAASSYTAGALAHYGPAAVLPPGLSREWFGELVVASGHRPKTGSAIEVLTAFRLDDWRDKGLPQLLEAVKAVGRPDIRVTVCGSGRPSPELMELIGSYPCCRLLANLGDSEFASELAAADLLVLATRTRAGRVSSGEGFGLVLLEAQVAGTPVIAPAYGGSHDAFIAGTTGRAPANESIPALAELLGELLDDPERLAMMGKGAAEWSRDAFAPDSYASLAVARLL